jgi:hypothetical protein
LSIGFKFVTQPSEVASRADEFQYFALMAQVNPKNSPGFVWRNGGDLMLLECKSIVTYQNTPGWIPEIFKSHHFHHLSGSTGLSTWPNESHIVQFLFCTDGKFIDQCACGLSMLGQPFFYFQDQSRLIGNKNTYCQQNKAVIDGAKLCAIEHTTAGKATAFFTNPHIQCVLNWLFRDEENKLLHPFHVVPLAVLA